MTPLLREPDVLPVRLLTAEPIAPVIEGVQLAKEDALMPVLEPALELEDVDCEPPSPERSDDNDDKGWLNKPAAKAPAPASDMIFSFDNDSR
ncbi:MAG: hypothetical protein ABSA49_09925 [Rhizomicrobium sp.]|jgi:hypothetical protein